VLDAGFVWDDDDYVTDNETVRDPGGLVRIWTDRRANTQYYPLVYSSFWLEHRLYGVNPFGYHLVNVALHAGVACLLLLLLRRLAVPGAFVAAAIFAVHPLCVQSVAWVTERKNVLMGVFYVGALLAYCRFCRIGEEAKGKQDWRFYGLSAGLLVPALLSKTVACSMPAVMLVLLWWKRRLRWRTALPLAPLLVVGAIMAFMTKSIEDKFFPASAQGLLARFPERTLIAGRALWTYVGRVVWPVKLTMFYPQWDIDPAVWWQWLLPGTAVAALAALWLLRDRLGRGAIAGVAIFAGHLFPALGYFDVYFQRTYSPVADHFAYLSIAALVAVLVAAGVKLSRKMNATGPALGVGGAVVIVLGAFTCLQLGMWQDIDAFWQHVIRRNPDCWMAYTNYGPLLRKRGQTDRAVEMYRKALAIKPDHPEALSNLANIRRERGDLREAVKLYRKAMEIRPTGNTAFSLARTLAKLGSTDEAIGLLQDVVRNRGKDVEARMELARLLQARGNEAGALAQYDGVLAFAPDLVEALNNAAWIRATAADPLLRDGERAVRLAEQAVRRDGDNPSLLDTLAAAYAEAGRLAYAVRAAEQALAEAQRSGHAQLQKGIEHRLALYRAGRPYRSAPRP
ncbi:MAG: tetratricopeptide repeat protein, partial [Planctomycetota bacterium]